MTSLDDLDLMDAQTPATPNVTTKRCVRHAWEKAGGQTVVTVNGESYVLGTPIPEFTMCARCGKVRDEATVRRNRGNRQRGAAFERSVAKKLGGRRTGPLGGRDDVLGDDWVAQTKRTTNLSLNEAQVYIRDLLGTYPDRVPLVIHALPGRSREKVVISRFSIYADRWGEPKDAATIRRPLSLSAARVFLRYVDAVIWLPEDGDDGVVIVSLDDWVSLHGEDGQ